MELLYCFLGVYSGIHTKNGEITYASRMMQVSLRFWSEYLRQCNPKYMTMIP